MILKLIICFFALVGFIACLVVAFVFIAETFDLWEPNEPFMAERQKADDELIARLQKQIDEEGTQIYMH